MYVCVCKYIYIYIYRWPRLGRPGAGLIVELPHGLQQVLQGGAHI